ncbi:hypothetical protein FO519_004119 [Halicephalobus sp. NKZ332]|nr:hypothetical protein FO519_004119 [Halicephalobus sp. NKZ332]
MSRAKDKAKNDAEVNSMISKLISEQHLQRWYNIAFEIYLTLTESHNDRNTVVCIPQVIATLELFAQAADVNCRNYVREVIFPENFPLYSYNGNLSSYIEAWENSINEAARPGIFRTQRKFLVHPCYSKSYGFETFMALKSLKTEIKILYHNAEKEFASWMKRMCKAEDVPEKLNPIEIWPSSTGKEYPQMINNRKCPIFIAVSHFEFPLEFNVLDREKVYITSFQQIQGKSIDVYSCKLKMSHLFPFKFLKINSSSIISLPVSCDNLSVYIIDNYDALEIKTPEKLMEHINSMNRAQINKSIKNLYLPLFFKFPEKTMNVGQALNSSVKEMDKLFQQNAFGDLAYDGSEPSTVTSGRTVANIQHYDYLELMKLPELSEVEKPDVGRTDCVICRPFAVIVWENSKKIPLYIARIGMPDRPNQEKKIEIRRLRNRIGKPS